MALPSQNSTNLPTSVAGSRLGLTREDLLSLLFGEEDGNSGDSLDLYQGVSPVELNEPQGSILQSSLSLKPSQTEPSQTTATFKTKGKGNVLGYNSGPSPTVEISGPIEEVIPLVPGPTGGLGGPEPLPGARGIETTPKEEDFLDTYIETVRPAPRPFPAPQAPQAPAAPPVKRTPEHTQKLIYNPAGEHVGTYHYHDGVQTDTSWVEDGVWKHSASYKGTPQSEIIPAGHTIR